MLLKNTFLNLSGLFFFFLFLTGKGGMSLLLVYPGKYIDQ